MHTHHTSGFPSTVPGLRRELVRPSHPWLDVGLQSLQRPLASAGLVPGGGQRAPGTGGADGGHVGAIGGRSRDGRPRFDQAVAEGGYLWWYLDALSADGQFGLTIIAFVGSVFSPYYAWDRQRKITQPDNYCALNVALYNKQSPRWTMTERGAQHCLRDEKQFTIGPSQLRWEDNTLVIDIDEIAVPLPRRVRGQVRVQADTWFDFSTPIDTAGKHRWGPLAPSARVEVDLQQPAQQWTGHAYLDSNEGDEPIDRSCHEWDWSRSLMKDGSTAVIYDIQGKTSAQDKLLALRFKSDGSVENFSAPPRQPLPSTLWRIQRRMRSDSAVQVKEQLEDTPFYQRALLQNELLGEQVQSFHETLYVPRLVSPLVQAMLPWRMPRRS